MDQTRASDILVLELQALVSQLIWVLGSQVTRKSSKYSQSLSYCPSSSR